MKTLSIFGSVARHEASDDSDVLVEFSKPVGLFKFGGLQLYLEKILGAKADLATPAALRDFMRAGVLREAIRAA